MPSYHIPFPRAFLSLNTPTHKKTNSGSAIASPEAEGAPHNFLSNKDAPRHYSISSESSSGTAASPPASPSAKAVTAPAVEQKVPAFLALNSKFAAPPATEKEMKVEKSPFLSNKH
jgi:hypothetical protein